MLDALFDIVKPHIQQVPIFFTPKESLAVMLSIGLYYLLFIHSMIDELTEKTFPTVLVSKLAHFALSVVLLQKYDNIQATYRNTMITNNKKVLPSCSLFKMIKWVS